MPRMLALDWTRHEARYVLATGGNGDITVNSAGAIDLSVLSDEDFQDADKLGAALQEGLAPAKPGRAVTLIGIDRSSVELLEFSVPSVPEAELPRMVLNMAMRESAAITEDSVLDFISTPADSSDSQNLTAVAMTGEELTRIQTICEAAKLSPQRLLLRAYATAALFPSDADGALHRRLLVNCVGDDADLTVIDAGHVIFSRTVRLPKHDDREMATGRLLQEIRRTMMVTPHSQAGSDIQTITILGRESEHSHLLHAAREEFVTDEPDKIDDTASPVNVHCFDVFAAMGATDRIVPDDSGRFAPLLGILQTEAENGRHAFDFLSPRKPPKPRDLKRPLAVIGGLVALVILFLGYSTWSDLADAKAANDHLADELKEMKRGAKKRKAREAVAATVGNWDARGVNWLLELDSFSKKFPSARDAMVLRMALTPSRDGGGTISFSGLARDPTVVTKMELSLRDDTHEVQTPRVNERVQENGYTWRFDTKVSVIKAKPKPKKQPAGQKSGARKKRSKKRDGQAKTTHKPSSEKKSKSLATGAAKAQQKKTAKKTTSVPLSGGEGGKPTAGADAEKPTSAAKSSAQRQAGEEP